MGLDMMMYKTAVESEVPEWPKGIATGFGREISDSEQKILDNYWKAMENVKLEEVAYWRKFNALHNWFVQECQDGIDQCQYAEVSKENIMELIDILQESVDTKKPLLQPQGGFFFGSTDIDEYYWNDVKSAIDTFERLYQETDWEKEKLIYSSSW